MICSLENVLFNRKVAEGIYEIAIKGSFEGIPGQFYMLRPEGDSILLPRPISIYDLNNEYISFLYAVVGKGTELIKDLKEDSKIQIMGPLGNGFNMDDIKGKVAMVSGGIGIAPLVYLSKNLKNSSIDFYAGFRDEDYSMECVEKYVDNRYVSTENGAKGHKGYITEILDPKKYDIIITCGPLIMMKKVINMAKKENKKCIVSMENRMACGLGACLGCTCKTREGNKTTCNDGPVFYGEDLIFNE
ncbi:dihydroorotate dehydrogenase electron transfer subunit [Hathewaya massiliensis]|uniref:dihydroorotate dehydrogenase electron transfer subunit n=1 Tax=Hathewaya massiliensis TaxID=1964382 RepID=UPI00115A477F|nr:dihydroorotate dehydrogenase electron transfer subunit [Hathewaya massiliensis]